MPCAFRFGFAEKKTSNAILLANWLFTGGGGGYPGGGGGYPGGGYGGYPGGGGGYPGGGGGYPGGGMPTDRYSEIKDQSFRR